MKAAASILLVLGLITAAANVWCLGPINQRYIPQAVIQAEVALERKVSHASCIGHYHEPHDACSQVFVSAPLSLAHSDNFQKQAAALVIPEVALGYNGSGQARVQSCCCYYR